MRNTLLLTLLSFSIVLANESAYTSIAEKDCKVSQVYENNMGASMACEKFEQFGVEVSDSDARMSITIKYHDIEYPQHYSSTVGSGFSSLGTKIEWRYPKGESYAPHAFIARVNLSIEDEKAPSGSKTVSKLSVSKIDKLSICVIGVIPPVKNQNVLARELSNKARTMPCLLEEQNHREVAIKKVLANDTQLGTNTSSQKAFNYARDMGPFEHALRVLKEPSFPIWRMRLRLYPTFSEKFPSQLGGYRVVADRINLSYALHDTLIEQYGVENVDPALKNTDLSQTYSLEYFIMRTPATFSEESLDLKYDVYLEDDTCGLQKSCIQLYEDDSGDWGKETQVTLTKAPWESKIATLPAMVRVLAQKAEWVKSDVWRPNEIPEGMNKHNPWVEVIIENHAGQGGGYLMEWHDLVSDDSIAKTLYRAHYDEASKKAEITIQTAVLCGRGKNKHTPTQMCQ
jgi:hypothetical protein